MRHAVLGIRDLKDDADGITRGFGRRLLSTGKIAASAARLGARRLVGAEGAEDGALGEAMARELDGMKGMAMKVGQILSYFDGVLPEDAHRALHSLQRGATAVSWETMGAAIERAFDAPVDTLFESFDRRPVASASIGQVYRARFAGRDVAVKVQYPGIRDTIAGDFGRVQGIASLASVATAVDGGALVRDLRARFDEECDYTREAASQAFFAERFAGDPEVRIPAVVVERSRETVLTTEWCEGDDFYAFAEKSDAARRSEVGLVLARFAYRSLFELKTLNADPHPGNYLFTASGPTVFLDFGCVRRFDDGFLEKHARLVRVVLDDDRGRFREALMNTGMVARERGFDFDLHWQLLCHELAPYRTPRFCFTPEYVRAGLVFTGPSNPNLRRLAIPPAWIWIERLQWGLHAVLARLRAEGPFAEVMRRALG